MFIRKEELSMGPLTKIQVDNISKLLESQGWSVVAIDTRSAFMAITIQKPKPEPERQVA